MFFIQKLFCDTPLASCTIVVIRIGLRNQTYYFAETNNYYYSVKLKKILLIPVSIPADKLFLRIASKIEFKEMNKCFKELKIYIYITLFQIRVKKIQTVVFSSFNGCYFILTTNGKKISVTSEKNVIQCLKEH